MANHSKQHSSKRTQQVTRTRRPLALWLASIGILIIVAIVVVQGISNSANAPTPAVVGAPRVSVEQDTFDYGDVKYGVPVTATFRITNVGDHTLNILEAPVVQVVEGCCPPRAVLSASTLNPGEEATITLTFSMHEGMGGPHHFNIDLRTNDPLEPLKQLTVLSNWIA